MRNAIDASYSTDDTKVLKTLGIIREPVGQQVEITYTFLMYESIRAVKIPVLTS